MDAYEISGRVIQNVRALRSSQNLSMRDLARRCATLGFPFLNEAKLWNLVGRTKEGVVREARKGVRIDEVFALANALGVPFEHLIAHHECQVCHGAPPAGFVCGTCGAGGDSNG